MQEELLLKDGQKVLVRDLQPNDDVIALAKFINELIEEKTYLQMDELMSPEAEADWLRGKIKEMEKGDTMDWRVWLDGKCVGGLEARKGKWKERGNVEFGIALSKEIRGQGLGKKLLSMMIEHAKKEWNPKNVTIAVYDKNEPAKALYKSLGFKEFARFPNWINHYGEYGDRLWLILND